MAYSQEDIAPFQLDCKLHKLCLGVNVSVSHPLDWTEAMDDALRERSHRCFLCGHLAKWQDIREVAGARVVRGCRRCVRRAGLGAVEARLRECYGMDRAPSMHPLYALPPPSERDQHEGDDHRKAHAEAPLDVTQVGVEASQQRQQMTETKLAQETLDKAFRNGRQARAEKITHKYARYSVGLYYKRLDSPIQNPQEPQDTYLITTCWRGR